MLGGLSVLESAAEVFLLGRNSSFSLVDFRHFRGLFLLGGEKQRIVAARSGLKDLDQYHSILRIVQILGKLGNWKRVLQLIEWLQSRYRFKCHRPRYICTAALYAHGKARRPVEALR
ncbi:hypothetical protein SASPL_141985 [Salvia splendens]|uniref:Uncharacterized protein n=1 Tax=Salvia splendens TaxID=180675 RepID=A0A8X8WJS0_SALSN|nr:hypothetical protein SASPL_141985 [Salvia splendens]